MAEQRFERHKQPWTQDEVQKLHALAKKGMALKAIANATGGQYFRARDGEELQTIKDTLDQLEPVEQQPTQARPAQALYSGPLALALILSLLLVVQERWPNNALQRLFNKLSSKGIFLQQHPEWRKRLQRLRLRRRR